MSTIKADNFVDLSREVAGTTPNTIGSEYLIEGVAKAWATASSAAVPSDNFNISSGVDNGVGDYSYNTSAALTTANYDLASTVRNGVAGTPRSATAAPDTTSRYDVCTINTNTSAATDIGNHSIVLGDLA